MESKYFSLDMYRKDFPNFPETHYETIGKLIADKGFFIHETLALKDISEVMERDLPADRPITQRTREVNLGKASRNLRISYGRIYTDEEMQVRRQRTIRLP
ncbi:hypothetical protein KA107_00680 [Candidatus Pacearchaeota archaeon]|nr:hypothetical protein [Candidatus Pacearchaeota archaeon]